MGIKGRMGSIRADQVGAPHRRERWFALADIISVSKGSNNSGTERKKIGRGKSRIGSCEMGEPNEQEERSGNSWWIESKFPRMVYGVPNRMDRKRLLGNAQVPLQAALAWKILSQ